MRLIKLCVCLAAILMPACALIPSPAHADPVLPFPPSAQNYQVFLLDSDEARFVYGIDPSGKVVLSVNAVPDQCTSPIAQQCHFETFIGGVYAFSSDAPPTPFTVDDGTPCSPALPSGLTLLHAVCNNGREVFAALPAGQVYGNLYTDPLTDVFSGQGTGVFLYLNSEGDILWNDPRSEFWFEAFDLTSQTPEPSSIFLLGTGALASLAAIRRRARLQQPS